MYCDWLAQKSTWVAGSGVLMCYGRLGTERSGVAERVEAVDQALGGAVLVDAVEVVGAEVSEDGSALQQGKSGDQHLVCEGHGARFRAHAHPHAVSETWNTTLRTGLPGGRSVRPALRS